MEPNARARIEARKCRLMTARSECLERMGDQARRIYAEVGSAPRGSQLLRSIYATDYVLEPVSIETFILDGQYLGGSLRNNIYPAILDDLIEIFEGDFIEICCGGAIGGGKTTEIAIGIAYEIYLVSCLKDPAHTYGLIPGSTLAFMNVSVDKRQAQRVLFSNLFSLLKRSPYFREVCRYQRNLRTEIRFPSKNIACYPVAGTEQAILGDGVFSAAFDELNFMATVERSKRSLPGDTGVYDQAEVITNKLSARIRSRFNIRGRLPGHLWFSSSARYPNDFTERKEAEAKTDKTIFVRRRALWESKPRHFFMPENFKVEVGDTARRTRVLDGTETNVTGKVIEVPMDFYKSFVKDPDRAVRDLAGYSVLSITPFIPRRECIRKMFELGTAAGLQHPFSKTDPQGRPLDVTLQDPNPETEVLVPERLHHIIRQKQDNLGRPLFYDVLRTQPVVENILFPGLHYAHVDLAKNRDAAGLLIGHSIGTKPVERLDEKTLQGVKETLPITRIDLALRIVAPLRGEIDIPRIRALFHQLREKTGMQFGLITFDQYQSQESLKSLKDAGFTASNFSVDDDTTAYDMLKQALYDERVLCYEFAKLEEELARLERAGHKVDHPAQAGGSKDLADCLAAVIHHVEEGWRAGAGSLGMFLTGIVDRLGQAAEPEDVYARAAAKVIDGQPLTAEEEDALLWGS